MNLIREVFRGCDNCGDLKVEVRRLGVPGLGGLFLCRKCWGREMEFRKMRNRRLAPGNKLDILKWSQGEK